VYVGMLILSAYAMAYHARQRSPEVLLAMALPWLLMFALLGQMHERYLLWGAVMSAAAAILRPSLFLLYAILTVGTCCMILTVMLKQAYEEILPPEAAFLDGMGTTGSLLFSLILMAAVGYVVWRPVAAMAHACLPSRGRRATFPEE